MSCGCSTSSNQATFVVYINKAKVKDSHIKKIKEEIGEKKTPSDTYIFIEVEDHDDGFSIDIERIK